MAKIIKAIYRHICVEELADLDIATLDTGSLAECSCGKQYELCEDQRDGKYWMELPNGRS